MLHSVLKSSVPSFDKTTEDGAHFRIYRLGILEVRSFQELDCEEIVGSVFSVHDAKSSSRSMEIDLKEIIIKATEYVERAVAGHRRYFLVLETETGHKVLTERCEDGSITWVVDPAHLEERISLAKVTRSKKCAKGMSIHDLDTHSQSTDQSKAVSHSMCKQWVRSTYFLMVGQNAM